MNCGTDHRTPSRQQDMRRRITGRLATGGLGLILGSVVFAAFMFYQYAATDLVLRDGRYGPVIWGLDGFQVAMHGMLFPLATGVVGVLVPLGRLRSALSRVVWAVVLVAVGVLCFVASWLWTVFVMFCWFMACPG